MSFRSSSVVSAVVQGSRATGIVRGRFGDSLITPKAFDRQDRPGPDRGGRRLQPGDHHASGRPAAAEPVLVVKTSKRRTA